MLLDLIGFWGWEEEEEQRPADNPAQRTDADGLRGGSSGDAGSGQIWRANVSTRATKVARIGINAQYVSKPSTSVRVQAVSRQLRVDAQHGQVRASALSGAKSTSLGIVAAKGAVKPRACSAPQVQALSVSGHPGKCETLDIAEVLALLGWV